MGNKSDPQLQLFTGNDFKAGPKILTITSIGKEKISIKNKPASMKLMVHFKESNCLSLLTAKRAHVMEVLFGDLKKAVGKRVELFRGIGQRGGKNRSCVTFRAPAKKQAR